MKKGVGIQNSCLTRSDKSQCQYDILQMVYSVTMFCQSFLIAEHVYLCFPDDSRSIGSTPQVPVSNIEPPGRDMARCHQLNDSKGSGRAPASGSMEPASLYIMDSLIHWCLRVVHSKGHLWQANRGTSTPSRQNAQESGPGLRESDDVLLIKQASSEVLGVHVCLGFKRCQNMIKKPRPLQRFWDSMSGVYESS